MELFTEEVVSGGNRCAECGGHHGIHIVTCSDFRCDTCHQRGADEDHRGGCPTLRRDEVRWQCQCGVFGWMNPQNRSLAGLVRHARREHKHNKPCGDPDIEQLETRDEYERRKRQERTHADVF
jgi:hypothetical protein